MLAAFNQSVYRAASPRGSHPASGARCARRSSGIGRRAGPHRRFAESHGESFDGASSVAVAVMNNGTAIASLSVFGPTEQVKPAVGQLVPLLTAASNRIARNIGH